MAQYVKYGDQRTGRKKQQRVKKSRIQDVWEARLGEAERVKQEWKDLFLCKDLERMYEGHQMPNDWNEDSWFSINLFFISSNILRRNVCPKDLQVNMKLARAFISDMDVIERIQQIIKVREAVLQHTFKEQRVWRDARTAYMNTLWQFGILKVGYSADMLKNDKAGELIRDYDDNPVVKDNGSLLYESDYIVEKEEFFVDSVDPDCFVVDRHCREDLDKTGSWCAQKFYMPVDDAKNEIGWNKKVLKNLGPSSLEESERVFLHKDKEYLTKWEWETNVYLPENEIIVGYEIYDLKRRETLTLIRGAEDVVKGPHALPPGVKLHPFVPVKFYDRKGSWYPIPVLFNWMGPQHEYNVTRNQMAIHRRRFNRKYVTLRGALEPEEKDKLQYGRDGEIIEAERQGSIEPIKDAPLGSEYFFDTNQLREEFMEASGVGQLQRSQTGAESATEAEIVENRSRENEVDEHEEMMIILGGVAKKMGESMEANLTQDGAVLKVGPGGEQWVTFGPEAFDFVEGEVLFEVEISEMARATLQVERAQLMQLLDIIGKNPMIALDDGLLRAVFDKFPALSNREDLIYRMQRLAAMQMQMQIAQIAGSGGGKPPAKGSKSKSGTGNSTKQVAQNSRQVATGR
jgi:hypothetical protein